MICLLRVGFDDAEEPDEKLFAPVTDRLGNYRIERGDDGTACELGRGAMGVTYRAVDTSLQRPVALKLIASEWVKRGAEARERFMREARTAAALRHPNVATVYHFGIREENGQCFCAMELVEGETLETRVRRTGPLDSLTTIEIGLQVSSALAAAEKQGLVHRDLKPANLMVVEAAPPPLSSSNDNATRASHSSRKNATRASHLLVKVIDFGVAKALVEKPDAMGLTHGGFVGTPAFASPEQFTDAPVGVRSDIYSLGATLWYLLTGKRPFQGTSIEQICASQRSRALPIEQLKTARVPARLISLIVSMLAPEPAARPSARALTLQLQDCREQILDRWKVGRRLAFAAGLAGLAATVLLLNRPRPPDDSPGTPFEKSIAVLQFENRSPDKNDAYVASGVRNEIVTKLTQMRGLKVISRNLRTKSGGPPAELRELGRKLGATNFLGGSIQRTADSISIDLQLIEAPTGTRLWAQSYKRALAQASELQGEVAESVADALKIKLAPAEAQRLRAAFTSNPRAQDLYLRAIALTAQADEKSHEQQIAMLREAVAEDPDYAEAWSALSQAYVHMGDAYRAPREILLPAREAAIKAVSLDDQLSDAHLVLGGIALTYDWNFPLAKREFERAIALDPNSAVAHRIYGWYLARAERNYVAARQEMATARRLDPLNTWPWWGESGVAIAQGDYEGALRLAERVMEIDPEFLYDEDPIAHVYVAMGRWKDALQRYQSIPASRFNRPNFELAICYAHTGQVPSARVILVELEKLAQERYVDHTHLAAIHAALGDKDKAFAALDQALNDRSARVYAPRFYPWLAPLREDPRFVELENKIARSQLPQSAEVASRPFEKSIAVLPFRNLSEDKDNAFFADGIQDDLVTSLARIKDLKVVSRSSVASYRDLSGRRLRAIAQELGVGAVLEGSVRRTANRVLVNVQLTDATTERQIWSDRYDRTLQDSIALQGELAAEIATALAAKLSPEEKVQVEAKLTNNPDAYVVYLRGREFQMRPEVSRDNFVAAEQCYRHAVALDARFALAHARLAEILQGRYEWFDHQPALLAEARTHAEEALRLDPHCGQAHMLMAKILSWSVKSIERDEAMKQEVDSALRLVPNDGYMVMIAALLQTDMDWLEEAEATFQRAIEINPREPKVFYNYAGLQLKKRDVAKARWASDRSLELAPESVYFRLFRAIAEFEWTGEVARTKKFLAEIPAGKDPDGRVTAALCTVALYERNFPEVLRLLAACPFERLPWFDGGFGPMVPKGFLEGLIHFCAGNKERAYTALDSARQILEMDAKENPGDQGAHFAVALAYAAMGWKDAALAEIARAKDKPDGWGMAALFATAGDHDAALRSLEQASPAEREHWYYDLRLGPHWDSLRSDVRFEKILASSAPKTAAVPEKSIAVLPFRNLSEEKENAFFADGIQDDLLTSLARIKDLKVVSRGSVASYRDLAGRKLRAIAQELGVGAVLEGSVRRTANRVLVNVQLTDATTERQIWSDRYDRTLQDSIALQGELAAEIATALAAKLSPEEKAQVEAKLTNNPDAYVVYLRGREIQMRPEVSRENYIAAEQCYRHAVVLDPRFALAHARLAEMLDARYEFFDNQPALLAEARSHAEEAVRLDPHCGQAHMEMAQILSRSVKSIERDNAIKQEVDSALCLLPNDGYLVMLAALFQTDMDWLGEAEATFQRAIEINPREPKVFYNYFTLLTKKGDVAKARWASDRSLELAPESVYFRLNRASEEFLWTGEVARTKKFLAEIPAGKDPDGRVTAAHCTAAVYERNFTEALRLLAACSSERLPCFVGRFGNMVPKGFLEGWIHYYAGNKEHAYAALDSARWILEMEAKENPGDQQAHLYLALTYAAMGWKDAAVAEVARAKEKPNEWPMAVLLVHAGQRDAALRILEQLPATERDYYYHDLRLNPHWDPLRSDARFEKMLASSRSKNTL